MKAKQCHIKEKIKQWEAQGKATFSLAELTEQYQHLSYQTIANTLYRIAAIGKIQKIWQGYYCIVYPKVQITPSYYMEALMQHLKRKYYVGLIGAVQWYTSSQKIENYTVITELPPLRNKEELMFYIKRKIREEDSVLRQTQQGYIKVSTPEITALDLVLYEKELGGLSLVVQYLQALINVQSLDYSSLGILQSYPVSVVQRLGYLLSFLKEDSTAESLYKNAQHCGKNFRKTVLELTGKKRKQSRYNSQWKIIINTEIITNCKTKV